MSINRIVLVLILLNGVLFLNTGKQVDGPATVSLQPAAVTTAINTAVPETRHQNNRSDDAKTDFYLRKLFCQGGLCADTDYAEWIVVDAASQWQIEEVIMVRRVLLNTIAALDDVGLDGRSLVAGYRFRRFNGPYVEANTGLIGVVRHHSREIILADTAFQRLQGFYIYHELGHVVDRRSGRQLSESYHHVAYGGYQIMEDAASEQWETANGYWLREQGRHDREEATADAFALWVAFARTDMRKPIFAKMPRQAYYGSITWTMNTSLATIKNGEEAIERDRRIAHAKPLRHLHPQLFD
jgi:hypothetical protein